MTYRAWVRAAFSILILATCVLPQNAQETPSPAQTPTTTAPAATASPIPVSDLIPQAESLNTTLAETERSFIDHPELATIENQLPGLTDRIQTEKAKTRQLLNSHPSIDSLNEAINAWNSLGTSLPNWQESLAALASELESGLNSVDSLKATWTVSLTQAKQTDVPPEVISRGEGALSAIQSTREKLDAVHKEILTTQERVANQIAEVNNALASIKALRTEALNRMFVKDSPPLWSPSAYSPRSNQSVTGAVTPYKAKWQSVATYCAEQKANLVAQFLLLLLVVWALYRARRRIRLWLAEEPSLLMVAQTFRIPFALGLVIVMLLSGWFYPNAPRLLFTILGLIAMVPTVIILRSIINPSLLPVLYALIPFFIVDSLVNVLNSRPLASRFLALGEIALAIIFLLWLVRKHGTQTNSHKPQTKARFIKPIALATLGAYVFSGLANIIGYVSLARLSTTTILAGANAAVLLYGAVIIAHALVVFALRVRPLVLLRAVRLHRVLIRQRIMRWIHWFAIISWVLLMLNKLTISEKVFNTLATILTKGISIGTIKFSLGDIVAFCLTIWVSILISRLISFLLEEEFFPRVTIAKGIPYAATKVMQYVVLFIGFILALAAVGVDLTHVTILTGALGVGLGFGLQNTLNNFVSGLILLFERPVNVDDAVQIGENMGTLRRIGLRASVLRTWEGSEVIVPNGDLISKEVINWTLSDQKRRLDIDVGVAYGTDPAIVIDLLTNVAKANADVVQDPPPSTLFIGFGDSALNFQLRAWTTEFSRWMHVQSDLAVAMNAALKEAKISIPFPQRDLHLQSITPEAMQLISANGSEGTAKKAKQEEQVEPKQRS